MDGLDTLRDLLPFIIPIIIVNLALIFVALRDLTKRQRVRGGNKVVWAIVIIFLEFIGPLVYMGFGRLEDEITDDKL